MLCIEVHCKSWSNVVQSMLSKYVIMCPQGTNRTILLSSNICRRFAGGLENESWYLELTSLSLFRSFPRLMMNETVKTGISFGYFMQ